MIARRRNAHPLFVNQHYFRNTEGDRYRPLLAGPIVQRPLRTYADDREARLQPSLNLLPLIAGLEFWLAFD